MKGTKINRLLFWTGCDRFVSSGSAREFKIALIGGLFLFSCFWLPLLGQLPDNMRNQTLRFVALFIIVFGAFGVLITISNEMRCSDMWDTVRFWFYICRHLLVPLPTG